MSAILCVAYIDVLTRANSHAVVSAYKFYRNCCSAKIDQHDSIFVYLRSLEHQNLHINIIYKNGFSFWKTSTLRPLQKCPPDCFVPLRTSVC